MKKPEKIVMYFTPQKDNSETFFDWNGKECHNYSVHLPYWLVRAYNLDKHIDSVKVTVTTKRKSFSKRFTETRISRVYYKSNWSKKYAKKRHNTMRYMRIAGPSGSGVDK